LLENVQNLPEKGFRWKRFSGLGMGIGGAGTKKRWGSARYHCSHTDLSVKAMGGFQVSHGLFISAFSTADGNLRRLWMMSIAFFVLGGFFTPANPKRVRIKSI